jgi:hypothetical protein
MGEIIAMEMWGDEAAQETVREECAFSPAHYRHVLEAAQAAGYYLLGFAEFLNRKPDRFLLLRHDVDVSLDYAVAMAEMEGELGARATYFVRIHAEGYSPLSRAGRTALRHLIALGHEVALQHEVGFFPADGQTPAEQLRGEIRVLEGATGVPVLGVARHMPKWGEELPSRDVLGASGMLYAAGDEVFNEGALFLSDASRRWKGGCPCRFIGGWPKIYLLTHPIWWLNEDANVVIINELLREGR